MEHNVLFALIWADTRDMLADGLTKGAVDREALHQIMDGEVIVTKEMKLWRPKRLTANMTDDAATGSSESHRGN